MPAYTRSSPDFFLGTEAKLPPPLLRELAVTGLLDRVEQELRPSVHFPGVGPKVSAATWAAVMHGHFDKSESDMIDLGRRDRTATDVDSAVT
jgi:hypothetical protein